MGRTLKRVPLDFAWPIDEIWTGYLNPFWRQRAPCPGCKGTGQTAEAQRFRDEWYGKVPFDPAAYGAVPLTVDHPAVVAFAKRQCEHNPDYYGTGDGAVLRECRRLLGHYRNQWCHHLIQADVDALAEAGRLHDFLRRPINAEQQAQLEKDGGFWLKEPNGYKPTADEVNAWSIGSMGHDAINRWVCVEARCKREGFESTCKACGGDGDLWPSAAVKEAQDNWTDEEPPTGDGFQLWTTTNEGAPISPVFATIEELCAWCADNATTFGSFKATADKWREMLDADFVVHQQGNAVFM